MQKRICKITLVGEVQRWISKRIGWLLPGGRGRASQGLGKIHGVWGNTSCISADCSGELVVLILEVRHFKPAQK